MTTPLKLAVYYGWPIAVNGTWSVPNSINVFNDYDIIFFGQGLESQSHPEHQSTIDIINGTSADIYGYVDSTIPLSQVKNKIDDWECMGVVGIFCDPFGFDFGLTRKKQNKIIDYIHCKNLTAFVNAWDPDDVFKYVSRSNGGATKMTPNDWYLAESYQVINGEYQNELDWVTKADKMIDYKINGPGCSKMAIVTTWDSRSYDQAKWDYAYYSCVLYNFDAAGFGEENFSASSAQLPYRPRKQVLGEITSPISNTASVYERDTNIGIHIDTTTHTASEFLD